MSQHIVQLVEKGGINFVRKGERKEFEMTSRFHRRNSLHEDEFSKMVNSQKVSLRARKSVLIRLYETFVDYDLLILFNQQILTQTEIISLLDVRS